MLPGDIAVNHKRLSNREEPEQCPAGAHTLFCGLALMLHALPSASATAAAGGDAPASAGGSALSAGRAGAAAAAAGFCIVQNWLSYTVRIMDRVSDVYAVSTLCRCSVTKPAAAATRSTSSSGSSIDSSSLLMYRCESDQCLHMHAQPDGLRGMAAASRGAKCDWLSESDKVQCDGLVCGQCPYSPEQRSEVDPEAARFQDAVQHLNVLLQQEAHRSSGRIVSHIIFVTCLQAQ